MQQFGLLDGFDPPLWLRAHLHHVARNPLPSIRTGSAHPDLTSMGLTRLLQPCTRCPVIVRTLASRCPESAPIDPTTISPPRPHVHGSHLLAAATHELFHDCMHTRITMQGVHSQWSHHDRSHLDHKSRGHTRLLRLH
jgi:hypothetical protein